MNKALLVLIGMLMVSSLAFASADTEETTEPIALIMGSGGSTISEMYFGTGTVDSGQTSEVVTVTGISTSGRCMVSLAEVATNSITVRAAVATANTLTVTTSGDPGASHADFSYLCME